MNELQCKINPEKPYFYCLFFIGHFLPGETYETMAESWGLPRGLVPRGAIRGVWHVQERSILKNILEIGASTNFIMVKLPKSGMEVRKQIKRPDLLQTFGPDDRGLYSTQVGSHIIDFVVGWETAEAAEQAQLELDYLEGIEQAANEGPYVPILVNPKYCLPPHRITRPEQVEELWFYFRARGWDFEKASLVGYWDGSHVQLLNGTHRHGAALAAGIELPVVVFPFCVIREAWGFLESWQAIMHYGDTKITACTNFLDISEPKCEK